MKLVSYARGLHDLNQLRAGGVEEVILEHKELSRLGRLSDEEFQALSKRARELGMIVLLEWDILMTEALFHSTLPKVISLLPHCDVLRVQDPGAFAWALRDTQKPLHFIAENGNHNLEALLGWSERAGARLVRLVLSIELPKATLAEYLKSLQVPCELLGLGRILLFYSPRSLLAPLSQRADWLEAVGESEESPHKGFPVVENKHGTFMFHIKEFCLLAEARELAELGLAHLRLDLRWGTLPELPQIASLINDFSSAKFEDFREAYPQDLMRGFYLVNKTDVLFPKLKNRNLQREGSYLGEVLETEKGAYLAIQVKNPRGLKKSDRLKIIHPKGEVFEVEIFSLKNSAMEEVSEVEADKLALIQGVNGVWVKSQVFYSI